MKTLLKKYDKRVYAIGVTFAVIFLTVIVWLTIVNRQNQVVLKETQRIVAEQSKNAIDAQMNQIVKLGQGIMSAIYSKIQQSEDSGGLDIYRELYSIIEQHEKIYDHSTITLYVPDTIFFSRGNEKIFSLSRLLNSDEGKIIDRNGVYWIVDEVEGDSEKAADEEKTSEWVLSCILVYSDVTDYDSLFAAIRIDLSSAILREFLYDNESNYEMILVDRNGRMLAGLGKNKKSYGEIVLPETMVEQLAAVTEDSPVTIADTSGIGEKYVSCGKLHSSGCSVLVFNSWDSPYFADGTGKVGSVCMMILVLGGLFFILINTYNLAIDSSISKLMEIAQAIESNKAPLRGSVEYRVDFFRVKSLRRSVDITVTQVMRLIDKQYRDEIQAKNLQMKALQAQINPHFLYNTLDVIKWMIASGDTEESIRMINALSRYFRFSLKKGRDVVYVKDEVELTKAYIEIMDKRFQGIFSMDYMIEEQAEECLMPKQTLQPIVENALLHGILDKKQKGSVISIYIFVEENDLCIEVSDNGAGMSEETLKALFEETSGGGGYGLRNVKERLGLFAGENAQFSIESSLGIGTTVSIRLKMASE